eukprot:CAMPEP_0118699670 /NCGR_PEP_ID=MMETSP0800-20121206/16054_1 /TAXON_ID=210618 ORGANISM="Striatella unipunctata, Strain CCMP2910" /NCGR_SAMPLE_ID=MMETSP0800 /ASSEMBLY_ACC=CAM_ASM_000638 /LENGTH=149 /DNA_ID=CAMNT_0006599965 /DNA_START=65 /DNA_END=512 /DNA_ORIENTATION=+
MENNNNNKKNTNDDDKKTPTAIIFIDEMDALAKTRCMLGHNNDERDQTLNQLLTEMDGFSNNNNNDDDVTVIVVAATNRPDVLDPAVLRRFNRHVRVPLPDEEGRRAILEVHAKRIRHDNHDDLVVVAAAGTEGFSGADLENVVNEAAW